MKTKPSQILNLTLLAKNVLIGTIITVISFQALKYLPDNPVLLNAVYYFPFVAWLVIVKNIGWGILKTYCISYEITETQIILEYGVFNRTTEILEIFRIKDISVDEPFIYRFFQKGNVTIISSDLTNPRLTLQCLKGFKNIYSELSVSVDSERSRKGVREFD